MSEGAEEPEWMKRDRELERETQEALDDLDAVAAGERPDAIPEAALNAAVDALLVDSGLPQYGPHRATVERRQRLAFDAALPFLRSAHPEAGEER